MKFKINSKGNGLAAYGDVEMSTSLLKVVGIKKMTVLSSNQAEAAVAEAGGGTPTGDLEISLMLDVTGSMCADGNGPCTTGAKISALKAAAADLVETVVWRTTENLPPQRSPSFRFSTRVRVGPDGGGGSIMKKLTNLVPTWNGWYKMCTKSTGGGGSEGNGDWMCLKETPTKVTNWKVMPCVTDRYYNASNSFDLTDKEPGAGAWMNAHDGGRMPLGRDSSETKATSQLGKTSADPADFWNYEPNGYCADVAQGNEVLPLTSDKTVLKSKISGSKRSVQQAACWARRSAGTCSRRTGRTSGPAKASPRTMPC